MTRNRSLVELRKLEKGGAVALAGATAAVRALALMRKALNQAGVTQRDVARALDITEGRVSQIVNGDGNVRMATLGRVLHAAGYELHLSAERLEDGAVLSPTRPAREFETKYTFPSDYLSSPREEQAKLKNRFVFTGVDIEH